MTAAPVPGHLEGGGTAEPPSWRRQQVSGDEPGLLRAVAVDGFAERHDRDRERVVAIERWTVPAHQGPECREQAGGQDPERGVVTLADTDERAEELVFAVLPARAQLAAQVVVGEPGEDRLGPGPGVPLSARGRNLLERVSRSCRSIVAPTPSPTSDEADRDG